MSMEGQGLTWQALEWADGTRCVQEGGDNGHSCHFHLFLRP